MASNSFSPTPKCRGLMRKPREALNKFQLPCDAPLPLLCNRGLLRGRSPPNLCFLRHVLLLTLLTGLPFAAHAQGAAPVTLKVYSAGSLKAAWTDLAQAYERSSGNKVVFEFGASGLLRERLEKGADGN